MTTFHRVLLTCPHCNRKMENYGLSSYTVFKSVVFSDGKTDCSPPIVRHETILLCYDCRKPFWKEDAIDRDSMQHAAELPASLDIYDLPFATEENFSDKLIDYYFELLNTDFCTSAKKEIYLRIQIWHLLNNKIRYRSENATNNFIKGIFNKKSNDASEKAFNEFLEKKQSFNDNLVNLIKVYTAETEAEFILLAEMFRELGEFDKAIELLKKIDVAENKYSYSAILKASKKQKTLVFKIN